MFVRGQVCWRAGLLEGQFAEGLVGLRAGLLEGKFAQRLVVRVPYHGGGRKK